MGNYGGHIPFDKVYKDRVTLVPILSEGNLFLMNIINYCISLHSDPSTYHKIETYECCEGIQAYDVGEYDYYDDPDSENRTYVMFEIDINETEYIYSILNRINRLSRTRYKIGQSHREDNGARSFLIDVSLAYNDRERANQFLAAVSEGLTNYKEYSKLKSPEVKSIINLLKDVYNSDKNLVIEKMRDNKYLIMSKSSCYGSPLNIPTQNEQILTLKEMIEVQPETLEQKFLSHNYGIQRTKQSH